MPSGPLGGKGYLGTHRCGPSKPWLTSMRLMETVADGVVLAAGLLLYRLINDRDVVVDRVISEMVQLASL